MTTDTEAVTIWRRITPNIQIPKIIKVKSSRSQTEEEHVGREIIQFRLGSPKTPQQLY